MKKVVIVLLIGIFVFSSILLAKNEEILIGLSMCELQLERWQKDRDIFVDTAEKLGAKVIVQSSNNDDLLQISQVENMINQGVDVLVIIAHDGNIMGSIVKEAHANGVPVIAYDRLLMNSDLDYFITFDPIKIGEYQAQYLVNKKPTGNYFLLGGSPTDNNAHLVRQGQMNILQPYIDRGDIKIVGDQWAKNWSAQEAMNIIENALTATKNQIDVIVASNDSTAGGAIEALKEQGLAGKVLVSGQDADLVACRRIVEGTQTMTVYKPIKSIATQAAIMAVSVVKDIHVVTNGTANNGVKEVPTFYLEPIPVDMNNIVETVIRDGFHSLEDVYKNIPKSQWPKVE
ncbi:D-xylose ABC transporter substrate-binding protein [Petrotoga sp. 9PWA.NaAc.5.4]|uniref:D-xylose ABC transporter substrate-binding protein n=1 Tax=Petrotoga sp. 9PWA.NaAc.5.4 TaxID=1434328 RepID=UPI000CB58CA2|nr:D-xylose ABC transporter substrate-binding protein [Petrotoga sp. 9PWA.NaAc.5.4]PNR93892.1 xylose ABC transporter substrate-binding protein [Petrotoga sp. 9PWA.NaAc.5.4]